MPRTKKYNQVKLSKDIIYKIIHDLSVPYIVNLSETCKHFNKVLKKLLNVHKAIHHDKPISEEQTRLLLRFPIDPPLYQKYGTYSVHHSNLLIFEAIEKFDIQVGDMRLCNDPEMFTYTINDFKLPQTLDLIKRKKLGLIAQINKLVKIKFDRNESIEIIQCIKKHKTYYIFEELLKNTETHFKLYDVKDDTNLKHIFLKYEKDKL